MLDRCQNVSKNCSKMYFSIISFPENNVMENTVYMMCIISTVKKSHEAYFHTKNCISILQTLSGW